MSIGLDIVSGLEVLHKHHIIHRDLKTSNVFVTLDEKGSLKCCAIGEGEAERERREGGREDKRGRESGVFADTFDR